MSNIFRELISAEPRSVEEVRHSLDAYTADELDLFFLLREHHEDLRDSISILLSDSADGEEKHTHLFRLLMILEMHAKAEQETLYVNLKTSVEKDARIAGFAGQDEHDIAFGLQDDLHRLGFEFSWNEEVAAKAKVLAGLVLNHIKEEEDQVFDIAEKSLSPSMLRSMGQTYLTKCRMYLDELELMPRESLGLKPEIQGILTSDSWQDSKPDSMSDAWFESQR